jgi:hypothetical protein
MKEICSLLKNYRAVFFGAHIPNHGDCMGSGG